MQNKPVCLLLNKCDLPSALQLPEIDMLGSITDLEDMLGERLTVLCTAVTAGESLRPVLTWLENVAAAKGAAAEM